MSTIDKAALHQLWLDARTHNRWQARPIADQVLKDIYDLLKWGPTSANCSPMRLVFVKSDAAKDKLVPCMAEANREKTRLAPATAIIAMDKAFYEHLPRLFPHNPGMRTVFADDKKKAYETAFRNSSLQGGYFILAARALGLDCGPMSGFDAAAVNAAFFADTAIEVNFVCNLGYGDPAGLYPRGPRFDFSDVAQII